ICLEDKEDSEFNEEHIFPESIGGTLVIDSVCIGCNSRLGHEIDVHLTDHFFVQGQRMLLNVRGKSGRLPNPLRHGTLVDYPEHKVISVLNELGKPLERRTVTAVKKSTNPDGSEGISIHLDKSDAAKMPNILNKILTRSGRPPLSDADILANQVQHTISNPWVNIQAAIDTRLCQRSVLKIAYELAWRWLGPAYLNDAVAVSLRALIFDTGNSTDWADKYKIRGNIGFIGEKSQYPFWEDESKSHIGFLWRAGNYISAYIRIFEVIEGTIGVSETPDLYPDFSGMFIAIDPRTGSRRESSMNEELNRLNRLRGEGAG